MGISIWQLLIVLFIVLLLFGTKKLKNIGADLGGAVRGFKGAIKDGKEAADEVDEEVDGDPAQIEQADAEAAADPKASEVMREGA